jgi:predicted RNA-binding protein with TRAM domain
VEVDDGSPQAGAQLEFSPVPTGVKSGSIERTKSFFPKKGQDLEMVCESLAYKGLGLCKVVDSGFVVFCERALPGERLVARIIKKRKGFAEVGFRVLPCL